MRTFFFLLLLAGLAMGFGYPVLVDRLGARDLGTFHLYDTIAGYRPVEVPLKSSDGPVGVSVEVRTVGQPPLSGQGAVLTLVVDRGGRSVLAEPLEFSGVVPREANPQTAERLYREQAGIIADVEDAAYRFTLGPGDAEGVTVESADLRLSAGTLALDPRVQPVGFALAATGFIGFVLALRRSRTTANPNSAPNPPRWGRGNSA